VPVIDDRGRLFGKLNLIDVITVAVVLGLIPLAYGAFLLFRVPIPIITSIEPAQVTQGDSATLKLTGSGFRPFLVARFGVVESYGFLVQSPTIAEVKVPDIPAGNYDFVLYDQARELVRMPGAVTVNAIQVPSAPGPSTPARWIRPAPPIPPPVMQLRVIGEFIGMSRDVAELIRGGLKLSEPVDERWPPRPAMAAEVLSVGATKDGVRRLRVGAPTNTITVPAPNEVSVPALIRASCRINPNPAPLLSDCWFGDTILAQTETLVLTERSEGDVGGRVNRVRFMITEVLSSTGPAVPPSRVDIEVEGEFFGLTQDDLRFVEVGSKFERWKDEPFAEVVALGIPGPGTQRVNIGGQAIRAPADGEFVVRAIIRISCVITANEGCLVDGTVLAQNATKPLPLPGRSDQLKFLIDEIRPAHASMESPLDRVDVQVEGEFFGLTQDALRFVQVGAEFRRWNDEPLAEVLLLGTPEPGTQRVRIGSDVLRTPTDDELAVRAIVRMRCVIATANGECSVDDTVLAQNATVILPVPNSSDQVRFLVGEMRPGDAQPVFASVRTAMATVRVRFIAGQEVLDTMNVGDVDLGGSVTLPSDADRAILMEIGQDQKRVTGVLSRDGLLGRNIQVEGPVVSFDGTVRVPVVFTESGWWYGAQSIKIGAGFNFQTVSGAMRGSIVDMVISDEKVGVAR
jgi:hypothetical protein